MKAVFAHDHWYIRTDMGYHDKGGLPEAILQKYVSAFGTLKVICRARDLAHTKLPQIVDPDIDFTPVSNLRSIRGIKNYPHVSRYINQIVVKADIVIARLPSTIGLIAARAARLHNVPCLIEVVGHAKEANILHGSRMGKLAGPIEHHMMRHELRKARHAVYITERYLQTIYPCGGRSYVCPNISVHPLSENQMQLRPNGADRVIGLVGSMDVSYKGHDAALKILARLVHEHAMDNVSLQFLGHGDISRWQAKASALGISEKVCFVGGLPPGQAVMSWMDSTDVILQPSLTEGQGRSIVEAMGRGRPVVASNVGGIPELLEHEMIFAPDDIEGLTRACHRVLTDDEFAQGRMRHNLEAASQFDADEIEARRQTIFEEFKNAAYPARSGTQC